MNSNAYNAGVLLWFALAVIAGYTGVQNSVLPPLIIFSIVSLLVIASFIVPSFRSWVCGISLSSLIAIHITRFVGFYFLYLYGKGLLPFNQSPSVLLVSIRLFLPFLYQQPAIEAADR